MWTETFHRQGSRGVVRRFHVRSRIHWYTRISFLRAWSRLVLTSVLRDGQNVNAAFGGRVLLTTEKFKVCWHTKIKKYNYKITFSIKSYLYTATNNKFNTLINIQVKLRTMDSVVDSTPLLADCWLLLRRHTLTTRSTSTAARCGKNESAQTTESEMADTEWYKMR